MTTYTTHMQIMTQLIAAQVAYNGIDEISIYNVDEATHLATVIIKRSQADAPIPYQQSTGPG